MKVLLVNTSESTGGAAIAAKRLMNALDHSGIQAKMLVLHKTSSDNRVIAIPDTWKKKFFFLWERFIIWINNCFSRKNLFTISIANAGFNITTLPEFQEADIIHLHWVNQGFLSLKGLQKILESGKPVVWTMHDMWPCTGICHHARTCTNYQTGCTQCQYLNCNHKTKDLSTSTFKKKNELLRKHQVQFITCSKWLHQLASKSALFKGQNITAIPNPIDVNCFCPQSQKEARERLGLPLNKNLILFGAVKPTDKRKGIDYMVEACQILKDRHPELTQECGIVIIGNQSNEITSLFPIQSYCLDYISDIERIIDVYNAVDTYVTPSLEENLPNTIMEAMTCGVPCVGFNIGGIPEMISHLENGYVAKYRNAQDFADGIVWVLEKQRRNMLGQLARQKAENEYCEEQIAGKYANIYHQLILNK